MPDPVVMANSVGVPVLREVVVVVCVLLSEFWYKFTTPVFGKSVFLLSKRIPPAKTINITITPKISSFFIQVLIFNGVTNS
jgi:hypothetical protein